MAERTWDEILAYWESADKPTAPQIQETWEWFQGNQKIVPTDVSEGTTTLTAVYGEPERRTLTADFTVSSFANIPDGGFGEFRFITNGNNISLPSTAEAKTTLNTSSPKEVVMMVRRKGSDYLVYYDENSSTPVTFGITGGVLDSNNAYVDVSFSEGVYDGDGSSALPLAALAVTFAANGGTATGASITSITTTTGGALTGGETTVRANLSITGTPDGNETVAIGPTNAASVYNSSQLAMGATETTGTLTLSAPGQGISLASIGNPEIALDVTAFTTVTKTGTDVTAWANRGSIGGSFTASAGAGGTQASDGDPIVFDGVDDVLKMAHAAANDIDGDTAIEIMIVGRAVSPLSSTERFFCKDKIGAAGAMIIQNATNNFQIRKTGAWIGAGTSVAFPSSKSIIGAWGSDNVSVKFAIDNVVQAENLSPGTFSIEDLDLQDWAIGGGSNSGAGSFANIEIWGLFLWKNAVLGATNRASYYSLIASHFGTADIALNQANHLNAQLTQNNPGANDIKKNGTSPTSGLNAAVIFDQELNGDGYIVGDFDSASLSAAAAIGLTTQSTTDNPALCEYLLTWRATGGLFRVEKLGTEQTPAPTETWAINGSIVRVRIDGSDVIFEQSDGSGGWDNIKTLSGETIPADLRPVVFISTVNANVLDVARSGLNWTSW